MWNYGQYHGHYFDIPKNYANRLRKARIKLFGKYYATLMYKLKNNIKEKRTLKLFQGVTI